MKTFRLPKTKKITVGDLLAESEVNRIIGKVTKDKANIQRLVTIQQNKDGGIEWRVTGFSPMELIGLLEQIKHWELADDGE